MINLDPGEKIIIEARRHWLLVGAIGGLVGLLAIAPIVILLVVYYISPEAASLLSTKETIAGLLFFGSSWLFFLWIIFFMNWTDYYLDVLVITNKKLIDVEQQGLFRRNVATALINNVQDIKIEIKGVVRSIFQFGDLQIQTGAVERELIIKDIKDPMKIKGIILDTIAENAKTKSPA